MTLPPTYNMEEGREELIPTPSATIEQQGWMDEQMKTCDTLIFNLRSRLGVLPCLRQRKVGRRRPGSSLAPPSAPPLSCRPARTVP